MTTTRTVVLTITAPAGLAADITAALQANGFTVTERKALLRRELTITNGNLAAVTAWLAADFGIYPQD